MRETYHPEHQKDFDAGYDAKMQEIDQLGYQEARNKFFKEFPIAYKPKSLAGYYFADGQCHALHDWKRK